MLCLIYHNIYLPGSIKPEKGFAVCGILIYFALRICNDTKNAYIIIKL